MARTTELRKSPHDGDGDGFYSPYPGAPDKTPVIRASSLDNRIKAIDIRASSLREKKAHRGLTPAEEIELDKLNDQYARMLTIRIKSSEAVNKPRKKKGLVPRASALKPRAKPDRVGPQPAVGGVGDIRARMRSRDELVNTARRAIARATPEELANLRRALGWDEEDAPNSIRTDSSLDRETMPLDQRRRVDSMFMYQWEVQEAADRKEEAKRLAAALRAHNATDGPAVRDVIGRVSDERLAARLALPPVYRNLPPGEVAELLRQYEESQKKKLRKRRGSKGFARYQPGRRDPVKYKVPNPKSTPKEIAGHHGHRPHGKSILWPALYEHLLADGHTKAAAAAISNAAWKKKRLKMRTNTPTSVRGVVKCDEVLSPWDIVLAHEAESASKASTSNTDRLT